MSDPNDEHPETLKMLQAQNAPTEDAVKKKIARLTAQLKAEREPPMSDLIVEIQHRIANMEKTLFDFPHIWPSEHYGSKIEYEDQLLILQRALARLREPESWVTVSRGCAGFLYAYLKQEDDIYVGSTGGYREELRIALSRQERTGEGK